MEAQEEFMGSNDLTQIVKGKRTKRQRSSSPYKAGITSSSSSGCGGGCGEGVVGEEYCNSISSPTTTTNSSEVYESTEEEEDMANCLILLAQGEGPRPVENNSRTENFSSRKFSDLGVSTTSKAGFYVYECKTCNRSFPSFQALGGHRASHKKPKMVEEKKSAVVAPPSIDHYLDECQLNKISPDLPPLSIHIASVSSSSANTNTNKVFQSNNKSKIHECTICGSQFTSGQALGGHMRRHRPNVENNQVAMNMSTVDATSCISTTIDESEKIKSRNILSLDLNLPAPEDDVYRESQFKFASTQQALVFSAPSLVDCHY